MSSTSENSQFEHDGEKDSPPLQQTSREESEAGGVRSYLLGLLSLASQQDTDVETAKSSSEIGNSKREESKEEVKSSLNYYKDNSDSVEPNSKRFSEEGKASSDEKPVLEVHGYLEVLSVQGESSDWLYESGLINSMKEPKLVSSGSLTVSNSATHQRMTKATSRSLSKRVGSSTFTRQCSKGIEKNTTKRVTQSHSLAKEIQGQTKADGGSIQQKMPRKTLDGRQEEVGAVSKNQNEQPIPADAGAVVTNPKFPRLPPLKTENVLDKGIKPSSSFGKAVNEKNTVSTKLASPESKRSPATKVATTSATSTKEANSFITKIIPLEKQHFQEAKDVELQLSALKLSGNGTTRHKDPMTRQRNAMAKVMEATMASMPLGPIRSTAESEKAFISDDLSIVSKSSELSQRTSMEFHKAVVESITEGNKSTDGMDKTIAYALGSDESKGASIATITDIGEVKSVKPYFMTVISGTVNTVTYTTKQEEGQNVAVEGPLSEINLTSHFLDAKIAEVVVSSDISKALQDVSRVATETSVVPSKALTVSPNTALDPEKSSPVPLDASTPPPKASTPPIISTVPLKTSAVPIKISTLPSETAMVQAKTSTVPPKISTVPPKISTVPPKISTVPLKTSTVPPTSSTVPPETATIPSETTTVQIITSTPLPKISTPLPKISTPLPKISTPLPKISTPLPKISTPLPKISTPLTKALKGAPDTVKAASDSGKAASDTVKAAPAILKAAPAILKAALPILKAAPAILKTSPPILKAAPDTVKAVSTTSKATASTLNAAPDTSTVPPITSTVPPITSTVPPITSTGSLKTLAVAPKTSTVPVKMSTVPSETAMVQSKTSTVQTKSSTVPLKTSTVPVQISTVPSETATVQTKTSTVQTKTSTVPPKISTVPLKTSTVPVEILTVQSKTAMDQSKTAMDQSKTAVVQSKTSTVPLKSSTVPSETATVQTKTSTVQTKTSTVPLKSSTVPRKTSTVPSETATVQTKSSTVPLKTSTVPVQISTVPSETATVQTKTSTVQTKTSTVPPKISTVPLKTSTVPVQILTVQSKTAMDQSKTAVVQSKTAVVQSKTSTVPSETATVQTKTSTVPLKSSTVPLKTSTVPVQISTVPSETATVQTKTSTVPPKISTPLPKTSAPLTKTSAPLTKALKGGASDTVKAVAAISKATANILNAVPATLKTTASVCKAVEASTLTTSAGRTDVDGSEVTHIGLLKGEIMNKDRGDIAKNARVTLPRVSGSEGTAGFRPPVSSSTRGADGREPILMTTMKDQRIEAVNSTAEGRVVEDIVVASLAMEKKTADDEMENRTGKTEKEEVVEVKEVEKKKSQIETVFKKVKDFGEKIVDEISTKLLSKEYSAEQPNTVPLSEGVAPLVNASETVSLTSKPIIVDWEIISRENEPVSPETKKAEANLIVSSTDTKKLIKEDSSLEKRPAQVSKPESLVQQIHNTHAFVAKGFEHKAETNSNASKTTAVIHGSNNNDTKEVPHHQSKVDDNNIREMVLSSTQSTQCPDLKEREKPEDIHSNIDVSQLNIYPNTQNLSCYMAEEGTDVQETLTIESPKQSTMFIQPVKVQYSTMKDAQSHSSVVSSKTATSTDQNTTELPNESSLSSKANSGSGIVVEVDRRDNSTINAEKSITMNNTEVENISISQSKRQTIALESIRKSGSKDSSVVTTPHVSSRSLSLVLIPHKASTKQNKLQSNTTTKENVKINLQSPTSDTKKIIAEPEKTTSGKSSAPPSVKQVDKEGTQLAKGKVNKTKISDIKDIGVEQIKKINIKEVINTINSGDVEKEKSIKDIQENGNPEKSKKVAKKTSKTQKQKTEGKENEKKQGTGLSKDVSTNKTKLLGDIDTVGTSENLSKDTKSNVKGKGATAVQANADGDRKKRIQEKTSTLKTNEDSSELVRGRKSKQANSESISVAKETVPKERNAKPISKGELKPNAEDNSKKNKLESERSDRATKGESTSKTNVTTKAAVSKLVVKKKPEAKSSDSKPGDVTRKSPGPPPKAKRKTYKTDKGENEKIEQPNGEAQHIAKEGGTAAKEGARTLFSAIKKKESIPKKETDVTLNQETKTPEVTGNRFGDASHSSLAAVAITGKKTKAASGHRQIIGLPTISATKRQESSQSLRSHVESPAKEQSLNWPASGSASVGSLTIDLKTNKSQSGLTVELMSKAARYSGTHLSSMGKKISHGSRQNIVKGSAMMSKQLGSGPRRQGVPTNHKNVYRPESKAVQSQGIGSESNRCNSGLQRGFDPLEERQVILSELTRSFSIGDEGLLKQPATRQQPASMLIGLRKNTDTSFDSTEEVLPLQEIMIRDKKYDVRANGLVGPVYFTPHKSMRQVPAQYRAEFFQQAHPAHFLEPVKPKDDIRSFKLEPDRIPASYQQKPVVPLATSRTEQPVELSSVYPHSALHPSLQNFGASGSRTVSQSSRVPLLGNSVSCPWFSCCGPSLTSICSDLRKKNNKNNDTLYRTSGYYRESKGSYKNLELGSSNTIPLQHVTNSPLVVNAHQVLSIKANEEDVQSAMAHLIHYGSGMEERYRIQNDNWFNRQRENAAHNAAVIKMAQKSSNWLTASSPFRSPISTKAGTNLYPIAQS